MFKKISLCFLFLALFFNITSYNFVYATTTDQGVYDFIQGKPSAPAGNKIKTVQDLQRTIGEPVTTPEAPAKVNTMTGKAEKTQAELVQQAKNGIPVVSIPNDPNKGFTLVPGAGGTYTLLAPIETFFPGGTIDVKGAGLGGYLNGLYKAGIAIATGLALIMIVVGGLEYVSTDSIQGKSNGRERIKNAILGLLLALTSYLILQQINPNLLKSDLQVQETKAAGGVTGSAVSLEKESEADYVAPVTYANSSGQNSISATPYTDAIIGQSIMGAAIPGTQNLNLNSGGKCKRGPNGINTSGSKIKPRNIPNMNWSAYALDLIKKSRLPQTRPSDAGQYFMGGQVTTEGWLLIIGGMIECESSFNPNTTFQEPGGSRGPGTLSVGLLQMSKEDPEASRKGYSSNDLKDPLKNLEVGIGRLESLVVRDGCITCWTGPGGWRGGSAYWSVLRNK